MELRYLFVAVRICMDTFSSFEVSISVLVAFDPVLLYPFIVGIMSIFSCSNCALPMSTNFEGYWTRARPEDLFVITFSRAFRLKIARSVRSVQVRSLSSSLSGRNLFHLTSLPPSSHSSSSTTPHLDQSHSSSPRLSPTASRPRALPHSDFGSRHQRTASLHTPPRSSHAVS